eukprot:TRINITY_DN7811_c0_g1_i1.p1 TRINITY_DN7811_c0_g1~~TRINITY_DN7811_c0_g1_i1.p1  ORF type:complete len:482 (-),score=132.61 TRINITY_DN7811_c0_g1_i1:3-1352(-)
MEDQNIKVETIRPAFPAVTCVSQTTYLTGKSPSDHGIISNGYYDKECCEIRNWHQSAKLVKSRRIFDEMKAKAQSENKTFTSFVNCWWHTMYDSNIDYLVTPRPQYLQDGGKLPDCYTSPPDLRDRLQNVLGKFPLGKFWGPLTSIASSEWIATASKMVDEWYDPTLSLIYLPHLDYCLQKYGPLDKEIVPLHLKEIDKVVGDLIQFYTNRGAKIIILSEYGISPVHRVIHPNRILRQNGFVAVRSENGGETLDCGVSRAFCYSDHQVGHVYVRDKSDIPNVKRILQKTPGIRYVLDANEQNDYAYPMATSKSLQSHHSERSGDLTVIADSDAWLSYYYWLDDAQAPDFARCVAIHRKPGYDPAEMFFRHENPLLGKLWLFFKLFLVYILHIRTSVDASPIRCDMIRGSHGVIPEDVNYRPVFLGGGTKKKSNLIAEDVYQLLITSLLE